MKCLGSEVKGAEVGFGFEESAVAEEDSLRALADVRRSVTKSLGVVGPGNWAER